MRVTLTVTLDVSDDDDITTIVRQTAEALNNAVTEDDAILCNGVRVMKGDAKYCIGSLS